ncbi:hypothetical protein H6G97_39945 [Nostoc flagelliforme FACHB-838]|uniref:Uncharacterized protein n=1 Tax=Nostoc flagelliforme FACHB-838 TaxID=2692904 RepID=A0ABR8E0N2_9NOSO|nr:hypothetical protein [Nostoc flagelliforme]MBD2535254.1 hypothetical protein [Nostoc flagelliforme FACHB-838]
MSQHIQTATLTVEISQEQSREEMLVEAIAGSALEDVIALTTRFYGSASRYV